MEKTGSQSFRPQPWDLCVNYHYFLALTVCLKCWPNKKTLRAESWRSIYLFVFAGPSLSDVLQIKEKVEESFAQGKTNPRPSFLSVITPLPPPSSSFFFFPSPILRLWQMTMQEENLCRVPEISTLSQAKQSPRPPPPGSNWKSLWMWCMGQDPFLKKWECCCAGTSLQSCPWRARWRHCGLDEERLARKLILERKEEPGGSLKTSVLNDLRLPVGNAFGFIALVSLHFRETTRRERKKKKRRSAAQTFPFFGSSESFRRNSVPSFV